MLVYEDERTGDIVSRLVALGNRVRLAIVLAYAVVLGAIFPLVVIPLFPSLWWVGVVIGALIGWGIGSLAAALIVVGIEWMAQMLVAQGEILAALTKDK